MPTSIPIKRKDAVALVLAMGDHREEDSALAAIEEAAQHGGGLLVPHGCRLYAERRGAILKLRLDGYAHDRSDLESARGVIARAAGATMMGISHHFADYLRARGHDVCRNEFGNPSWASTSAPQQKAQEKVLDAYYEEFPDRL
jgi:hypothetical protein